MIEICAILLFLTLITVVRARNEGFIAEPGRLMTLSFIAMLSLLSIMQHLTNLK